MIAYHGDPDLRAATLAQLQAHAAADEIVQGRYWESGKGCAVGCLTHDPSGGHATYPTRWGIPSVLAHLEDRIFEGLGPVEAKAWPLRFMGAIQVGADLSLVWPRFAVAILSDPERGVARLCREGSSQSRAVEGVVALFRRQIQGEKISVQEWECARSAASDAASASAAASADADASAAAAASADASAASASAAASADASAADASASAAAAADAAAAAYSARREHFAWMADALVSLLEVAS